jgi:hypothetical protein
VFAAKAVSNGSARKTNRDAPTKAQRTVFISGRMNGSSRQEPARESIYPFPELPTMHFVMDSTVYRYRGK